jgi:predicted ATPase
MSGRDAPWLAALPPVPGPSLRLTRVIGRDSVIDAIDLALDQHRLVTVVGPGGIGKSTVAQAAAARRHDRYAQGTRFMDLGLCREAGAALPYIAGALDLDVSADASAIATALSDAAMLIVLDNCEHVIEVVADLVNHIAVGAPGVQLLATSREALRVPGERVHRLASLDVPPLGESIDSVQAQGYSAIALFAERATAVASRFTLADTDVPAAVEICHRLDGIPLAIELAAARVDSLGLGELAARLDDRFSLLTNGRRTALPRHRTLAATLDWSYDTLLGAERITLARLSVFRGSFSLASAIAVVGDDELDEGEVTQAVADLAAKSLLSVQAGDDGVRYRLLETTRQYGWQKLDDHADHEEVRERHANVCLTLVRGAATELLRLRREEWMQRYGALVADLQDALDWALSPTGKLSLAMQLMIEATPLGEQNIMPPSYFERMEHLAAKLRATGKQQSEAARLGLALLHSRVHRGADIPLGRATIERLVEGDAAGADDPAVLSARFGGALLSGRHIEALRMARAIRRLGLQRGEPELEMLGARTSAQANFHLGNFDEAMDLAQRVLHCPFEYLPYSANNHRISMRAVLACCTAIRGDFDAAMEFGREAIELGRKDNPFTLCLAIVLGGAPVALWKGEPHLALRWITEGLDVAERNGAELWRLTLQQMRRGAVVASGSPDPGPDDEILPERIGPTPYDFLPTFAPALLDSRTVERVAEGNSAWNAAEVQRITAIGIAERSPREAVERLHEAATLAERQRAVLWLRRIENALAALAPPAAGNLSFGPGRRA